MSANNRIMQKYFKNEINCAIFDKKNFSSQNELKIVLTLRKKVGRNLIHFPWDGKLFHINSLRCNDRFTLFEWTVPRKSEPRPTTNIWIVSVPSQRTCYVRPSASPTTSN